MINANNREQSEFNSAIQYLNRLNYWFTMCGMCASNYDPYGWLNNLSIISRELSTKMKPEEQQSIKNKILELNIMLSTNSKKTRRFGPTQAIEPNLFIGLHEFELRLRTIMHEAGLESKVKDDLMAPETSWDDIPTST